MSHDKYDYHYPDIFLRQQSRRINKDIRRQYDSMSEHAISTLIQKNKGYREDTLPPLITLPGVMTKQQAAKHPKTKISNRYFKQVALGDKAFKKPSQRKINPATATVHENLAAPTSFQTEYQPPKFTRSVKKRLLEIGDYSQELEQLDFRKKKRVKREVKSTAIEPVNVVHDDYDADEGSIDERFLDMMESPNSYSFISTSSLESFEIADIMDFKEYEAEWGFMDDIPDLSKIKLDTIAYSNINILVDRM
jgi:hypothetical protein